MKPITVELKTKIGTHKTKLVREAIKLADKSQEIVTFHFNGLNVAIAPNSNEAEMLKSVEVAYHYRASSVGPEPFELTPELIEKRAKQIKANMAQKKEKAIADKADEAKKKAKLAMLFDEITSNH